MARIRHSAEQIINKLLGAKVLIERWRHHHNKARPHSSLGYRPPAPEATSPEGCFDTLRSSLMAQGSALGVT